MVVLAVIYTIATYNGLIRLQNRADEGFSDIDVQLKRRHDLIPNLVETVKGYAAHERQVLENVTPRVTPPWPRAAPRRRHRPRTSSPAPFASCSRSPRTTPT